ncbi:MAG: metallophosphoesterase [Oscillospiraceae bacterium]|jgi:putative phosphoesterase|nr:metallophosphoesterase [Oscillospiraceae bacterium]
MKISVFSDSHKDFNMLKRAFELESDSKLFIHLGDGEFEFQDLKNENPGKQFVFIKGNCDYGDYKSENVITVGNYKMLCVHGHTKNVHDGLDALVAAAKLNDCKIALYGHTHVYKTEIIDGVYVMNPGSISAPRGHNPPTFGVIDIDIDGNVNMKIVELKREPGEGEPEIISTDTTNLPELAE